MYIIMFSHSPKTTTLFQRLLNSSHHQIDIIEETSGLEELIECPLIVIYNRSYEPTLALCDYLNAIDTSMNLLVIVPGLDDQQVETLYAAGAHSVVTGPMRASDVIGAIQSERHTWWQPHEAQFVRSV